jgi:uncharacterized protein (UPF0333 family)
MITVLNNKMKSKRGDITIETVIKIVIALLMLFIILFIAFRNTEAMKAVWEKITGFF